MRHLILALAAASMIGWIILLVCIPNISPRPPPRPPPPSHPSPSPHPAFPSLASHPSNLTVEARTTALVALQVILAQSTVPTSLITAGGLHGFNSLSYVAPLLSGMVPKAPLPSFLSSSWSPSSSWIQPTASSIITTFPY
jgi:hypothetical protein